MATSGNALKTIRIPSEPGVLLVLARTSLRHVHEDDATSLVQLLDDPDVRRFTPGAPSGPEAFRRFVSWAERRRQQEGYVCLAIELEGRAIGLIQAWPLEPTGEIMEWGFALGRPFWGRGLFQEAAHGFVGWLSALGVERLEARSALCNTRGTTALVRLGARPEGLLRQCVSVADKRTDALLWSIIPSEWAANHQPAVAAAAKAAPAMALVRVT
jgi:ribosomal-protein-alanine N-acetyltransferase